MKLAILILAAVTLAGATLTPNSAQEFSPEREYRYEYESQILTGIPTLDSQYSGLKVKATAVIHMESDKYVTLKLTNMEVYKVREETGVIPTTMVPPSLLEFVPSEHSTELIESLVIPIKFRYETGLVTKVYAVSSDPYWSVNIKRGVISLMNLDLNAENPVAVDSSISRSFMGVVSSDYSTMSAKTAYKVIEPSTLGDCETFYNMVPIPSMSEMIVSKVVDTKRCAPKVMGEWGLFSGIMSGRNASEMDKMIHPSVTADYVLAGSRHSFLIKSAVLVAKYTHAPIVDDIVSMDGYVIQKLTFVKDEPIGRRISFDSTPVPLKRGLHAYVPLQALLKKKAMGGVSSGEGRLEVAKIEMVDRLMERIIEKTVSKVEKEVPDMVSTIVSILRTLSKDELMHVVKKYCRTDVSGETSLIAKKKTLILDILPTLPHPDVPLILVRLVKEGYISGVYAGALINIATLVSTPSPVMVNELIEMAKDPEISSKPVVHRAVILGTGILAHKLVNLQMKMGLTIRDSTSLIKAIVREIKSLLDTSDVETKISVIKCIGNSGIVEFFPDVARLIKDKTLPDMIRTQAIFAVRRMAAITPEPIRSILLPIYLDPTESEEVRVAAFVMIMETRPGFTSLKMIGRSLSTEPSIQIASFVYSYLNNVARSPMPDIKPTAIMVKRVLLTVKPVSVSPIFNSRSISLASFCKYLKMGFGIEYDKINKPNRVLPSAIIKRIGTYVFGKSMSLSEVGIEMEGMDEILRKLVGSKGVLSGIWNGEENIKKMLDPLTTVDLGRVEREIRRILTETDIPTPTMDPMRLGAYFKLLDNELNFFSANRDTVKEIVDAVKSSSSPADILSALTTGYNVDILKAMPLMDNAIVLPTPMGLPISLNVSVVSVMAVKGQIKLNGISSISSIWNTPSKVSLDVKLRPSVDIKYFHTMGIQHDIISAGTTVKRSVQADIPLSFRVEIDRAEEKIAVKMDVPKEVSPFIRVSMKPEQFTHFVPIRISSYSASMYETHIPRTVPISCSKTFKSVPITAEYVVPILAMKAKISGEGNYPLPSLFASSLIMMSRQELIMILEPAYSAPDGIMVEVFYGKRETVVRSSSDGWFSWMSSSQVEDEVSVDEFVPVTPNTIIPSPAKKQIFVNVLTVGGYHDAKIKTKLTLIHNPSWLLHQINCQVVSTNIVVPLWKAKVESLVNVPVLINTTMSSSSVRSTDIITSTEMSFGVNSFTENTIIAKLMPAHVVRVTELERPLNSIKNISVKLSIFYSRVADHIKENMIAVGGMVKPWIVPYLSNEKTSKIVSGSDNVEIIAQFFPQICKVNAIVATPESTVYIMGLSTPEFWPFVMPIIPPTVSLSSLPVLPEITTLMRAPSNITSSLYGRCIVTPGNVTTIANNTIMVPDISPDCEVVLAHDCSPQKLYTVLAAVVTSTGQRTMKVIIPHFKVEVLASVTSGEMTLVINEAIEQLPVRKPLVITRSVDGKIKPVLEIITSASDKSIIVRAPEVGLIVRASGIGIMKIEVSPLLMSSMCGVCALVPKVPTVNPWISRIGIKPMMSMVPSIHPYVVKSDRCPAIGVRPSRTATSCHTVDRNAKITRVSEGVAQVCFSVRPIPTCAGFCSPASTVSESVGFTCLPANDYTARTLSTDVTERVLTELSNRMVHTYEPIMVPTQCVA